MDVTCATCREPWDTHHLRHDEVWETDLTEPEARAFSAGSLSVRDPTVRAAFERLGWRFADSVLAVLRCPACPEPESEEPESEETRTRRADQIAARVALAGLLEGDEDALACELEDLDALAPR